MRLLDIVIKTWRILDTWRCYKWLQNSWNRRPIIGKSEREMSFEEQTQLLLTNRATHFCNCNTMAWLHDPIRKRSLPMSNHAVGRSTSKFWSAGATHLTAGRVWPHAIKHGFLPRGLRAEVDRCWWSQTVPVYIIMEIYRKSWVHRVPSFMVTRSHRNWHGSLAGTLTSY